MSNKASRVFCKCCSVINKEMLHKEAQQTGQNIRAGKKTCTFTSDHKCFNVEQIPVLCFDILIITHNHLRKLIKMMCSSYFVLLKCVFLTFKSVSPVQS